MKTAIVYDRVNKWGGAERILLALNEIFPDAQLFTSVYDREKAPWAKVFPKVTPSFLQKIPVLKKYHELLGWIAPLAYESFSFDEYDLVISVTSEAAKGIITKPKTKHLCICLTPTRYLWSGYREYLENPTRRLSWIPFYKYVSLPLLSYLKHWDLFAAQRPDIFIAISTAVKYRIKKYYNRDSVVIYPPVDVKRFQSQDSRFKKSYYLVVSRLVPYKKVDLAIKAFNELGLRLKIVGTGSEEKKLKRMAKKNIHFAGFVDDKDLPDYYRNAKALIMPQEEDFGIVAVEAQAAGVPVISYSKGGAQDTVVDGKTGLFFERQTEDDLKKCVESFQKMRFEKSVLFKNAERFSKERFQEEFLDIVKRNG
jgi:glycosyltransferase involved in cell wall biosynthesis